MTLSIKPGPIDFYINKRCFLFCGINVEKRTEKSFLVLIDLTPLNRELGISGLIYMVARPGIEPGTQGFSVLCSTD